MRVEETELAGVFEITNARFVDDRGWFSETWNQQRYADIGLDVTWVQDNESLSVAVGTVRGLHFQIGPQAQDKLVRAASGRLFDVAVDLRLSSPTFGKWVGRELSAEIGNQLLVPKGFAHGFATLTANCRIAYKVSAPYDESCDRAVAWNDRAIGIEWPIDVRTAVLSARDEAAPLLTDAPDLFT